MIIAPQSASIMLCPNFYIDLYTNIYTDICICTRIYIYFVLFETIKNFVLRLPVLDINLRIKFCLVALLFEKTHQNRSNFLSKIRERKRNQKRSTLSSAHLAQYKKDLYAFVRRRLLGYFVRG